MGPLPGHAVPYGQSVVAPLLDLPADAHPLAGEALWMWANEQAERARASR
ncbi:hypothetical protein [Streptomyces hawaiiensis]|nr:hypothetical protein [Streptomyces hawaiiensis]